MSLSDAATIISSVVASLCAILTYLLAKKTAAFADRESGISPAAILSVATSPRANENVHSHAAEEMEEIILELMKRRNSHDQGTRVRAMVAILAPPFISAILIMYVISRAGGVFWILIIAPVLITGAAVHFGMTMIPKLRDERFRALTTVETQKLKLLARDETLDLDTVNKIRESLSQFPILYSGYGLILLDNIMLAEFYRRATGDTPRTGRG